MSLEAGNNSQKSVFSISGSSYKCIHLYQRSQYTCVHVCVCVCARAYICMHTHSLSLTLSLSHTHRKKLIRDQGKHALASLDAEIGDLQRQLPVLVAKDDDKKNGSNAHALADARHGAAVVSAEEPGHALPSAALQAASAAGKGKEKEGNSKPPLPRAPPLPALLSQGCVPGCVAEAPWAYHGAAERGNAQFVGTSLDLRGNKVRLPEGFLEQLAQRGVSVLLDACSASGTPNAPAVEGCGEAMQGGIFQKSVSSNTYYMAKLWS